MNVPTLNTFLSPILTVALEWNTGETGDINRIVDKRVKPILFRLLCWKRNISQILKEWMKERKKERKKEEEGYFRKKERWEENKTDRQTDRRQRMNEWACSWTTVSCICCVA